MMRHLILCALVLTLCQQAAIAEEYSTSWVKEIITYKASTGENSQHIQKTIRQRIQKQLPTLFETELTDWKAASDDRFVLRLSTIPADKPEGVRGSGGGYAKDRELTLGVDVQFRVMSPQVVPQPVGSVLIEVEVETTVLWEQRIAGKLTTNLFRDRLLTLCTTELDRIGKEQGVRYELVDYPQQRKHLFLQKLGK